MHHITFEISFLLHFDLILFTLLLFRFMNLLHYLHANHPSLFNFVTLFKLEIPLFPRIFSSVDLLIPRTAFHGIGL